MELRFTPDQFLGGLAPLERSVSVENFIWYQAAAVDDGLHYAFPAGALADYSHLTCDLLLDGNELAVFVLTLQEGEDGPVFRHSFGLLNQVQARLRLPLEAVNQNRWMMEREGAWLKPLCWGDRVDLARVDRMALCVYRMGTAPVRFGMTSLRAVPSAPERLDQPLLLNGPLLDELGQSRQRDWAGRSASSAEVSARLRSQLAAAHQVVPPPARSPWGGANDCRCDATGFFRVLRDGSRWWLVDPAGFQFWSAGVDCVRVDTEANIRGLESALSWLPGQEGEFAAAFSQSHDALEFNYLAANLIRAFGPRDWYERWAEITLAELRRIGFNTVGNWSDWKIASQAGFPYVRHLEWPFSRTPLVYRDFPDVFHPDFEAEAQAFAAQLADTRHDPALIGYFLMNEPTWAFAVDSPAVGLLFNTQEGHARRALAEFLDRRYPDEAALSQAWGMPVSLSAIAAGQWTARLTDEAREDLDRFSGVMVSRFFGTLSEACRRVDPNHLNLGIRYYTIPPAWALDGMRTFDVFSMNCYRRRLPAEEMAHIANVLDMPVLVGEWHFGALDAGLPASGIGHVHDQVERGKAYRVYLEDAAAQPWCVGVHYFNLYDQSALGRFDGENYNIGFLDVCNRPYEELAQAARASHERLYRVANGESVPYNDEPGYLPLLFM